MALQIVYNVLLTLSNTVLVAVSFFLVMATCKYFHFFVAFPFIVAPLAVVTLLPVNASIVQIAGIGAAAVTALALLMMVIEFVAIGPLRRRGATAMQLTLVPCCVAIRGPKHSRPLHFRTRLAFSV
jgi:uncharacterized oligopeptide transporter (OPT) family protein